MAEELLPTALPALLISDSLVIIGGYRTFRDGTIPSNRTMLRKILSGTGKGAMGRIGKNLAHWSKQTRAYFQHSAAFYHLLGKSDEPFKYCGDHSNLAYECLDDSEEESEDKEEGEDDVQRNMGAADLLEWHHHKTNGKRMKDVIHNDTMPTPMGPINQGAQLKKLHRMQKDLKKMISTNKNQPWPEKYFDRHPHRPMIKCDSHQLRKDDKKREQGDTNNSHPAWQLSRWMTWRTEFVTSA